MIAGRNGTAVTQGLWMYLALEESVRQALYAWSTEQGHRIVLSIYTASTATRINVTHHEQPQITTLRHMRQT